VVQGSNLRALSLKAQPQPGDLHDHCPHPAIACLADALVALTVTAVIVCQSNLGGAQGHTLDPVVLSKAYPVLRTEQRDDDIDHQQDRAGLKRSDCCRGF